VSCQKSVDNKLLATIVTKFGNILDGMLTEEHFGSLHSLQEIDLPFNSLKIEITSE
jgi:hypothetical protein